MATSSTPPQANGMATAGLVCGILGLVLFWLFGWILSLLAIIFGAIGIGKARQVGRGRGAAIGGLVCGVIGIVLPIVAVIAIPAFLDHMNKSKPRDGERQLRVLERQLARYYQEHAKLPPSAEPMPGPAGCANGEKHPVQPASAWVEDPGWRALRFSVDEPSYYTYQWTQVSATEGFVLAIADLDCDGDRSEQRLDVRVETGNLVTEVHPPTPD
jgi:hypothetical protein